MDILAQRQDFWVARPTLEQPKIVAWHSITQMMATARIKSRPGRREDWWVRIITTL
jgi:hypothetical protein